MRLMDYNDILQTENTTFNYSNTYLRGFAEYVPKMITVLLQVSYFTGKKKNIKTLDGQYHSYCANQYLQLPYSFRACFVLYSLGHYMEACFILRHIVEVLMKMKYLNHHKDYIDKVWRNMPVKVGTGKNKRRITLRDMFEEVSPGYYDTNYGKLFSGFHHGGTGTLLFRVDGNTQETLSVRMGLKWDERMGTFVVNHYVVMMYIALTSYAKIFPEGFVAADIDFLNRYTEVVKWLKLGMAGHKNKNPKSVGWYKEMEGLISL